MSRRIFITGIGTDVGKTIVSAIVTEALHADYWKPIQSGDIEGKDSDVVRGLLSNSNSIIHPEYISLKAFMSPHAAAALEKKEIKISDIVTPKTSNTLVVEGAGGLMVPINDTELVVDLISYLQADVILVSSIYLGSINHTLLSHELLKQRNCNVLGIVFNGPENKFSEEVILNHTKYKCLGRIKKETKFTKELVAQYAAQLEKELI
ncbi:MAG: dethiobiotin synthase [Bacteroidetes bacterium]|nr:dethiobiotin synthase [Bacteroidota bacterium]